MYTTMRAVSNIAMPKKSILDIESYVKSAKEKGLPAVGMSDFMSIVSADRFFRACEKYNITPIYGVEILVEDGNDKHLVLFVAKNELGYYSLLPLLENKSVRWEELNVLEKDAVFALVGGSDSLFYYVAEANVNMATSLIEHLKQLQIDTYLEITLGDGKMIQKVNDGLLLLRDMYQLDCVISNTALCKNAEDDLFRLMEHRKKLDTNTFGLVSHVSYLVNEEEARLRIAPSDFFSQGDIDKAFACTDRLIRSVTGISPVSYEAEEMPAFVLYQRCFRRLTELNLHQEDYINRLNRELYTINLMGYTKYFLTIANTIAILRKGNVAIGPGRGSVVGSLVAYLLGITQINPMKYGLLFERFLDVSRKELPDIDIDVSSREKAFEVLGKDASAPSLIIPTTIVRQVDRDQREIVRLTPHVSACVVAPYIPEGKWELKSSNSNKVYISKNPVEDFEGLLKIDLLESGFIRTLNDVYENKHNAPIHWCHNDDKVWTLFKKGIVAGIFQVGTDKHIETLKELAPQNIEELATYLALMRGPMIKSGLVRHYINRRNNKEAVTPIHDIYDEITNKTYGFIIFQEQVMKIIEGYGMSLTEGLHIMKMCAKKKDVSQYKSKFMNAAKTKGCTEEMANQIWAHIENTSAYSFNKAHAIAYAHIVMTSAVLKLQSTRLYAGKMASYMKHKGYKEKEECIRSECERIHLDLVYA